MKKIFAMLLALVMVLSMVACQPSNAPTTPTDSSKPADNSSTPADPGTTGGGNSMAVCLASEPDTIDPALNSAVDGATLLAHLFSGLAKWSQDANGALMIAPDAAEELVEGVINDDGTVSYTYTLREGLKWSDGKDVTASDFVFAWKRAASEELGADYGYMFEVVKGYPNDLAISAPDDRTFEVTLTNTVAYWDELLAFPTFFPVREDVVSNEAWATDASTYIGNGAYKMTDWVHNSVIELDKNPDFVDADQVTMDRIEFYLSDDANNMLTNFENGSWAQTYDVLISAIKTCTDNEIRYKLMHEAEDLLMSTGCIVPLYFYTDIYMLDDSVHGFFSNPLGYKYFMHCTIDK